MDPVLTQQLNDEADTLVVPTKWQYRRAVARHFLHLSSRDSNVPFNFLGWGLWFIFVVAISHFFPTTGWSFWSAIPVILAEVVSVVGFLWVARFVHRVTAR